MRRRQSSQSLEIRVLEEANWYLEHKSSLRDVAKNFGLSKSTVHKDLTEKLKHIDSCVWRDVMCLINYNKEHVVEKMNFVNQQTRWKQNISRGCNL